MTLLISGFLDPPNPPGLFHYYRECKLDFKDDNVKFTTVPVKP